jgi:hypothetical protein
MTASAWRVYREFKATLGKSLVDLTADTIKCALFLSTSNCGDVALVTAQYATLTNQHANANGYTTAGVIVAATYTQAGGVATFDVADPSWTASVGSIVARYAVLYDDSATNKDLIAYCLLDVTPADVTAVAGTAFLIQVSPTGVFQMSGGEA